MAHSMLRSATVDSIWKLDEKITHTVLTFYGINIKPFIPRLHPSTWKCRSLYHHLAENGPWTAKMNETSQSFLWEFERPAGIKAKPIKKQFEEKRCRILTTLMLPHENPRLAWYTLPGNRSSFLETDGILAWLRLRPQMRSSLYALNKGFDRKPILYRRQTPLVNPINRKSLFDSVERCFEATDKGLVVSIFNSMYSLPETFEFSTPMITEMQESKGVKYSFSKHNPIRHPTLFYLLQ